jgi:hypothetical protein
MRGFFGVALAALLSLAVLPGGQLDKIDGQFTPVPRSSELAYVTCFKSGEQISGMNKICFYNCLGSGVAITISALQLCPLTIQQ